MTITVLDRTTPTFASDLGPQPPHRARRMRCGCGTMLWLVTSRVGAVMALDDQPSATGRLRWITDDNGSDVVEVALTTSYAELLWSCHWAACPNINTQTPRLPTAPEPCTVCGQPRSFALQSLAMAEHPCCTPAPKPASELGEPPSAPLLSGLPTLRTRYDFGM